jgi:hypothetical protein
LEPCIPEINGIYGSDQGIELPLGFLYQIATSANANIEEILGNVESSISRTILPELFADQCAPTRRSRRGRKPTRRLEVRGVSSLPADKVFIGGTFLEREAFNAFFTHTIAMPYVVPCQGDTAKKDCHVIDGAMTLFSDLQNEELLDDVHGLIRDAMNDGEYNNAHPDIVEISYWNRKTTTIANTVVDSPPTRTLPVYFWILIGIGIAGCVAFFGVWWRQRQKKNEGWNNLRSANGSDSLSSISAHSDSHSCSTPSDRFQLCGSYLYIPRQTPNAIV